MKTLDLLTLGEIMLRRSGTEAQETIEQLLPYVDYFFCSESTAHLTFLNQKKKSFAKNIGLLQGKIACSRWRKQISVLTHKKPEIFLASLI